jgi:spermidine/putrescine transport system substrate-binding protein
MKSTLLAVGMGFVTLCVLLSGCKRQTSSAPPPPTTASSTQPTALPPEEPVVNVYVFSDYLPKDVLDEFTRETGIKVNHVNFSSNEELAARLRTGTSDFDLVGPSDYMVRRLADEGYLRKLDKARLPGMVHLDPGRMAKPFDSTNAYSVPLFWGTTGIGYNKAKVGDIDSWAALFDPKHSGQIGMLNDGREALVAALRKMGRDPSSLDAAAIDAGLAELRQQRPLVKIYDSDTFHEKLLAGDVRLQQGFNGQFAKAIAEKPDELAFVVPKEGGTLWIDTLAIAARARHPANAHTLMDYLMRPDVAAKVATFAAYATPNLKAFEKLEPGLRNNPIIYPPADVLSRCQSMEPLSPALTRRIDALLTEVKR